MTNALVGRCDAPTAQRRAPATQWAIGRTPPMLVARVPALGHRFFGFVGLRLQTSEALQDHCHFAQVPSSPGRFHPRDGLHRCAIGSFGSPREVLRTVVVGEDLTRPGQQRLDVLPNPRGPITDDAQAHLLCRHQARRVALFEGLAALLLIVHLRPTAPMDDALTIQPRAAQPLRVTPLAPPPRPLGPRVPASLPGLPSAVGTGRYLEH